LSAIHSIYSTRLTQTGILLYPGFLVIYNASMHLRLWYRFYCWTSCMLWLLSIIRM